MSRKIKILNIIGTVGYVACLLQWLWAAALFVPILLVTPFVTSLVQKRAPEQPLAIAETHTAMSVPPLVSVLGFAFGVVVLFVALYIIAVRLPRTIAKTGETITHAPVAVIAPVVAKHIHLKKKQRRELPARIIFALKMLFVFVPFCVLAFAGGQQFEVSLELIMFVGAILFAWALFVFVLQFFLSRFLGVDYKNVR